MSILNLLTPSKKYEAQVMLYRQDFLDNNDTLNGCA
jgi:hypothetical protein